jgi:hypothetical protein
MFLVYQNSAGIVTWRLQSPLLVDHWRSVAIIDEQISVAVKVQGRSSLAAPLFRQPLHGEAFFKGLTSSSAIVHSTMLYNRSLS